MSHLKIYKASAGSGKTYTLALEYIKELLLKHSFNSHRNILAVTFTKDATGEMKDRILAELYGLAFETKDSEVFLSSLSAVLEKEGKFMKPYEIRGKAKIILYNILRDYSHLNITTIDSFFQRVLRNLARELGKGSKFNLEMNSTKVLSDAVSSMIEKSNENPQLLNWLTTYIENKLEEGGNWRIEKDILNFSKCIFDEHFQEHEYILREQINNNPKIFQQLWDKHFLLQKTCKTLFKKSYSDITKLLENYDLNLSDFSRNGTVINFFKKLSEGNYATINSSSKTIKECLDNAEKWSSSKSKRKNDITIIATMSLMPLLNQSLDTYKKFNTSRMITQNIHQLGLIWDITNEIESQNKENNRFMLADTALFLNQMIDDADAPFIYEKIGAEVKHVMIDEFQDTSRLQWKNFKSLLSEILANNYFSLIVGDVKQSIYRWRNGDWNILNGIEEELNIKADRLEYNYRSEKEIINFNNQFFLKAAFILDEKFKMIFEESENSPFKSAYTNDIIQLSHRKNNEGYVSINFFPDKKDEISYEELTLKALLQKIEILYETGIKPEQICILTRTNKQIIRIADFLSSQKQEKDELNKSNYLNIISNEAFQLNSSPAVRIIIEAIRVITDPDNTVYKTQLEYLFQKYKNAGDLLFFLGDLVSENWNTLPLFELLGHLYRYFHLEEIEGQSSYMFAFFDAVNAYLKDYPADNQSFLKFWNEELQFKSVPYGTSAEGIRAMTIHKSKGLQFHTLLLPFCDWELYPDKNPIIWCGSKPGFYDLEILPVKYTHKMQETVFIDEYRQETTQSWIDNLNLLYVAFTRAECNLFIFGKSKKKKISIEDVKNVSDLLMLSIEYIDDFDNQFDIEKLHFEKGYIYCNTSKSFFENDNLLKKRSQALDISFVSNSFKSEESVFKQSKQSREFINNEVNPENDYLSKGNILHLLFSYINTNDSIEKAVEQIYIDGLITYEEKNYYKNYVINAISSAGVENWYSNKYKIYNESEIIIKEKNEITTKRPDRILINDEEIILIDYKFGKQYPAHHKQMQTYIQLMQTLSEKPIKAFLWYVEQKKLISLN